MTFKKFISFVFIFQFLFLVQCALQLTPHSQIILPSVGEDVAPADSSQFYMDLDTGYYAREGRDVPLYDISTTEEFGDSAFRDSVSNCEIEYDPEDKGDPTTSSSETMICILDIMEQELVISDLNINYNVPEGMCAYVEVLPAWHYNYETGLGPYDIRKCEYTTGGGSTPDQEAETKTTYCAKSTENAEPGATRPKGCTDKLLGTEYNRCAEEIEDLCKFKVPKGDEEIICCDGTYNADGEEGEWAGADGLQQCLGGPGRTSWEHLDDRGFPAVLTQYVFRNGLKGSFRVKNLLEATGGKKSHSTPVANYLRELDLPFDKLQDIDRTDLPVFLQGTKVWERNGSGNLYILPPYANPFFTVACLDQAGEVLHEIKLMVREWNTHEEFIDFYTSGGDDRADPDVLGKEGEDCEYEDRSVFGEGGRCNDSLDFNDFVDGQKAIEEFFGAHQDYLNGLFNTNNNNNSFDFKYVFPNADYE